MSDGRLLARFRYRIYPTKAQQEALARTFGCCRVVYNDYLELRQREQIAHSRAQSRVVARAKRTPERAWLAEVSSVALNQTAQQAEDALLRWWRGSSRAPRFRSKKSRQSFRLLRNGFSFRGDCLHIAKVGDLKVRWSRALPSIPSSVTIIKEPDGRYYASFVVERELDPWPVKPHSCGVDLGLTHFATVVGSDGGTLVFENPRYLRAAAKKLARAQRSMARKQKGSRNRDKARIRVAVAHRRVRNKRLDQHHKVAHWLLRENQAVAVEDLNVAALSKTRLSKSIRDAGWSQFLHVLSQKADLHCRQVVKIDRWTPTTRACSSCGANEGAKPLSVRKWTCGVCGATHDRDVNAARNILVAAGLAETQNACGADVRPSGSAAVGGEAGTSLDDGGQCTPRVNPGGLS